MTQLHLDLQSAGDRVEPVWTFGGTVAHAPLLLRKDVQRHLQICRDELGFRHLRCRGLLSDEMGVLHPDGSLDFTQVEEALDVVMENHYVPYVELAGVPRSLAQPGAPPEDWGRWYDLVHALAERIDGRYGCDANDWYFQVGDDASSWRGTREEFFRLYDVAARAIKEVSATLRVGPVAGGGEWLDEFLRHVAGKSEDYALEAGRCDFVALTSLGARSPGDALAAARQKVTETLGENIPLICRIDEVPGGSPDDCARAAAVVGAMAGLTELAHGAVSLDVSDIDEETGAGFRLEPFHGGRGLLTVNDIRKASFNAFRLLRDHSGYHSQRVPVRWTDPIDGLGCLATKEEYTLRLLAWYYPDAAPLGASPRAMATFSVDGLAESIRFGQVEVIRPGAGSPYETWLKSGRPPFVNRELLDALEDASHPATAEVDFREYPPRLEPGMVMQLTVPLPYDEPSWA
jgi:xylan 1,4-beta-xylosidase